MSEAALFEGREFEVDGTTWIASVSNAPGASAAHTDLRIFDLVLQPKDAASPARRLRLRASHAGIETANHLPRLYECVRMFLRSEEGDADIQCF